MGGSDDLGPWRRVYSRTQTSSAEDCPEDEVLAALVLGESGQPDRQAVARHVVGCRRCSAIMRDLFDLEGASRGHAPSRTARRRTKWAALTLAAAAVILAVAVPIMRKEVAPPGAGAMRGAAEVEGASEPPHGARLGAPPSRLAVAPLGEGTIYRFVLFDDESTPIWSSAPGPDPWLAIPGEVRARLSPGRTYYWRAFAREGLDERALALRKFTIEP